MSIDITFKKSITLEEVEKNTNLTVEKVNDKYYITDSVGNHIYVCFCNGEPSKATSICYITQYGNNTLQNVMDEIVVKMQTEFITDNEEQELYCGGKELDIDLLFEETTRSYGYSILNGVISKE